MRLTAHEWPSHALSFLQSQQARVHHAHAPQVERAELTESKKSSSAASGGLLAVGKKKGSKGGSAVKVETDGVRPAVLRGELSQWCSQLALGTPATACSMPPPSDKTRPSDTTARISDDQMMPI